MHIIHKQLTASAQTKDKMDRENAGTRCKDITDYTTATATSVFVQPAVFLETIRS